MNVKKIKKNKGFVLLFAVMLSSIILAVTMSVANIAFQEIKFGTSAKDTNDAFFAADSGAECALSNDKSTSNSFLEIGGSGVVNCFGGTISLTGTYPAWSFIISGLGNAGQGCSKVTVDKSSPPTTIIVSKGYNDGGNVPGSCNQGPNSIERQIELNY